MKALSEMTGNFTELAAIMNTRWKELIRATVMVPEGEDEFWAFINRDAGRGFPCAWSRAEFELKLAAAGMELTGREIPPVDAGLSAKFCADHRIRAFEVRRIDSLNIFRSS